MKSGRSSADDAMNQRLEREERMAAQERGDAAREQAGALTDMWERTYRQRSLFRRGMYLGVAPPPPAPAVGRTGASRISPSVRPLATMARDSGGYGPGQRPTTDHSKWKSR